MNINNNHNHFQLIIKQLFNKIFKILTRVMDPMEAVVVRAL